MMMAKVEQRQSVFDLALQYFGSAEAAFLVAERLGCSITDTPTPGAEFDVDQHEIIDRLVVNYYRTNNIIPTTEPEYDNSSRF